MKQDNIIKFPGSDKKTAEATASKLAEIVSRKNMPEKLKETDSCPMMEVNYSVQSLKSVPDLASGGSRNRRWAAIVSLGVIPSFDETPTGPVLLPKPPTQIFTADDLDMLRDRLVYEIDQSIALTRLAIENPEEYSQYNLARLAKEAGETENSVV